MESRFVEESLKLAQCWAKHDARDLCDYLVAGPEDPRINPQSILSRHFLASRSFSDDFEALFREEYKFSVAMAHLAQLRAKLVHPDDLEAVLHALRVGGDNAEGIELSLCLIECFKSLPVHVGQVTVPNYVDAFLRSIQFLPEVLAPSPDPLDVFKEIWAGMLPQARRRPDGEHPLSVIEPACGSANDYRFLQSYGLAAHLDYYGFDICDKNVTNAHAMFPGTRFETANVFDIQAADQSFSVAFAHDLFEHLSIEGMELAIQELCRVTRDALCVHFFNMDETRDHAVRPVEGYYWNRLSMARVRDLFASHGFEGQALHVGAFMKNRTGCEEVQNPQAYTFVLDRQ